MYKEKGVILAAYNYGGGMHLRSSLKKSASRQLFAKVRRFTRDTAIWSRKVSPSLGIA
jgi:hypothetical protein